jgi:hypothetical protein
VLFRGASPSGDDSIRGERDVGHAAHFGRSRGVCRLAFKSRDYLDRFARNYDFDVVAVDTIVWRKATPALMSIVRVRDGSLVVIPELPYRPMTNFEFGLRSPTLSACRAFSKKPKRTFLSPTRSRARSKSSRRSFILRLRRLLVRWGSAIVSGRAVGARKKIVRSHPSAKPVYRLLFYLSLFLDFALLNIFTAISLSADKIFGL